MASPAHRTVQSLVVLLMRALDKRTALERAALEWLVPVTLQNLERILTEPITADLLAQVDRELLHAYLAHRDLLASALELLEEAMVEDDLTAQIPAIREHLKGSGTEDLADWTLRFMVLLWSGMSALLGRFGDLAGNAASELHNFDFEGFLKHPASGIVRVQFLVLALVEAVSRQAAPLRAAEIAVHAFLAADQLRTLFGLLGADLNPDRLLQPAERGARALRIAGALARSLDEDDVADLAQARLGEWSPH